MPTTSPTEHHDVVVVGARVAGAATALLLARAGLRVLVVDRASYGSDTPSTHALMRGAVVQLDRWGLLDRVVAAGTPPVTTVTFRYGPDEVDIAVDPLYAPRRTVLDPIVVDAAREAGAEVRFATRATDVHRDRRGRVVGVSLESGGRTRRVGCQLLVGADGLRSWVARRLEVPVTWRGRASNASIGGYFAGTGLPTDRYLWASRPGLLGGSIPTTSGQHVLFASMQPEDHRAQVADGGPRAALARLLPALGPDLAEAAEHGRRDGSLISFPGHVGQLRKAHGPGWALVGDAGYFKDPGAAHGISDAFRDAELLARAVLTGDLPGYEARRDAWSAPLLTALEEVVDHSWTLDQLPGRHLAVSRAMSAELATFSADLERSGPDPVAA